MLIILVLNYKIIIRLSLPEHRAGLSLLSHPTAARKPWAISLWAAPDISLVKDLSVLTYLSRKNNIRTCSFFFFFFFSQFPVFLAPAELQKHSCRWFYEFLPTWEAWIMVPKQRKSKGSQVLCIFAVVKVCSELWAANSLWS